MGKYTKKDAAEETETSASKVTEAWHDAQDDAQADPDVNFERGGKNEGPLFKDKK